MGQYQRHRYLEGWNPSADAFNAPQDSLLRMDNCVLDEHGAIALRPGSIKVNTTAFQRTYARFDHTGDFEEDLATTDGRAQFTAEFERAYIEATSPTEGPANHNYLFEDDFTGSLVIGTDEDVHSLDTFTLGGTVYRMTGADDAVYANSTAIWASVDGTGDISFGAHLGHILFARGTTKKKYNGQTVFNLGIATPTAAPTLVALAADTKVLASCATAESPAMTSNEGAQAFVADRNAVAAAAVELSPDATTGRAMSTKTFAAPTTFATYDGGQIGTDEDLLDFWAKFAEPQYITSFTVQIDVNTGLFDTDWYERIFRIGDAVSIVNDPAQSLESIYTIGGQEASVLLAEMEDVPPAQSRIVQNAAQWANFNIPRGSLLRHGLSEGKNWATVKAVRVIVNAIAGGTGAAITFDEIRLMGGAQRPLTGRYKAAVVFVRNDGTYTAKSAPSAFSTEIEVRAQGIQATVDANTIAAADGQVNEIWLYLMGTRLNDFYRAAVKTGGPFFHGAQNIEAISSEITILSANIRMERDNTVPPDDIVMIAGPHYDRTLYLTAQFIYPSRQLNSESCSAGEVVRVGDNTETALWIKKLGRDGLYVGTTRDIYEFTGDWTVQPDGSLNITKRPLHVSEPPISKAVDVGSVNGTETLIYLSGDGWHALGHGPLVNNAVDLLWRGYTRHGVSFVNITSTSARFRVAVAKNLMFAITPEGGDTTSSDVLHVYNFTLRKWYRFVYPQAFRSIHAEADGTLIAGDAVGFVRTLDLATKQDDGANIPVTLWTPVDDNGEPFTYKDPENMWLRLATADVYATVNMHLNGSDSSGGGFPTLQTTTDTANVDVSDVASFSQLQLRITGSFSTFTFRGWGLRYLDNPLPQVIHDTGFVDLAGDVLKWVKRIRVKAKSPVDFTVRTFWDGVAGTSPEIEVGDKAGIATVFDVPMGREDKGRVGRAVVTSTTPSHVYWIEFWLNGTGKQNQKRYVFTPEAK